MEGWLLCLDTVTNPFGFGSGLAQPTDMGRVRPIQKTFKILFFFPEFYNFPAQFLLSILVNISMYFTS